MKKTIILIIFWGLSSCIKQQPNQIIIDPGFLKPSKIQLSEYADEILYIPLSSKIPIRSIRAIDFCDNFIFIGAGTEGLLVYNADGNFYKQIGNRGKGPGEYYSVNSFSIDTNNKFIYILDAGPMAKIIVYTFNGDFKYEFSNANLNGIFQKIAFQNEKLYLFEIIIAGRANYNWVEIDLHGKVVSIKTNSIPHFNTTTTMIINPVYLFDNGIGYWNQYNDTVFRIENGLISTRLFFGKGEYRLPTDNSVELSNFFRVKNILESNNYFWVVKYNRPNNNVIIIDKNGGTSKLVRGVKYKETVPQGLINDLDGGGNFEPNSFYNSERDEYLIGWIDAYQLKAHVASEAFKNSTPKYPKKKKVLEKLANSLNENDNPVLMLVKLKE